MAAKPAPLFFDDANRAPDLVFGVGTVDEKSQPHRALPDPRVEDRLHIDPTFEEGVGQGNASLRITDDQRHD
jgi:hypothetical protein